ncbi:MAG TPA: hypothetical protein VFY90_02605 [Tepidiformaceae bacterium]|nr:hypothetical protein [Tepidiformaceae bacterium]
MKAGLLLPHDPPARFVEVAKLAEATGHVLDALTLAGTVDEVAERVVALARAGIGQIIICPLAPPDGSVDDSIRRFGQEVVPAACRALRR